MDQIVVVSAARTSIGSFAGAFNGCSAVELGAVAVKSAIERAKIAPEQVDELIMGQVLSSGCGQNPARQAAVQASIPEEKTALVINQLCGSGLRSVAMGYQSLRLGESSIVVAGGQESMSQAPHFSHVRSGLRLGHGELRDTLLHDGLTCAINGYHMGTTAENIAERWQITRQDQDAFACESQNRAERAIKANKFKDEIVPVTVKKRKQDIVVDTDEFPNLGTTYDALAKLRPAFKKDGSVTAGNASGINDGAAAVVLMRQQEAEKRGIQPLAIIRSWATAGVASTVMGSGPIPATKKALERASWTVDDLDLIESNEAFAAQSLCVIKELNLDPEKTNVNGGAIALGHPIGASGTRILVSLLYEMGRRDAKKGVATLCIGGGMGIAMCLESIQ